MQLDSLISLIPAPGGAVIAESGGASRRIGLEEAHALFRSGDVIVAHALFVAGRLKAPPARPLFDAVELFARLRPAQPCVPSALGLARGLGLPPPHTVEEAACALHGVATLLLDELKSKPDAEQANIRALAASLYKAGWRWAPLILEAIGAPEKSQSPIAGFDSWRGLPQWEDDAAPDKPGSLPVEIGETRQRLAQLVGAGGEVRTEQEAYAEDAAYAFGVRERAGAPKIALIEAGTGIGKTLGYLASASLWAEKNGPGLWLSTYTRNLQRQIVQELARLYPDPAEREEKAVVRKGRENYLCLLNFEEAAKRNALAPGQRTVALGFIARVIRRARHAPIVVANHALVIAQASGDVLNLDETNDAPPERRVRYVFDEGHHLFDAADSGFAAFLSGYEMADLRRWIRGPEARARTRMRGLEERLEDIVADDEAAQSALEECISAAGALAGEGWLSRLNNAGARGPGEVFLAAAYQHVRARSADEDPFYSLEADTEPLGDDIRDAAQKLGIGLRRLSVPLLRLAYNLRKQLTDQASELETYERARIEAAARGLERRAKIIVPAWIAMLDSLENGERREEFVDWFAIEREDGRDSDVGLWRHWIDPTIPLAAEVLAPAHGALITSATLRDADGTEDDWQSAEVRTGAAHLPEPPKRASYGSPFDYAQQSRIFVIKDVNRRDADQLGAAYRELFLASGGGALGLFTAVRALRAVEKRISAQLIEAGINLYAQHVDRFDTGALVDLFRAEENACLLGTDALRDGVDVPGRSLRLVVFDKVPWPKPTILHKARRARFGKSYDDLLTRLVQNGGLGPRYLVEHNKTQRTAWHI